MTVTDVWSSAETDRFEHQDKQAKQNGHKPFSGTPSFEGYMPPVRHVEPQTEKAPAHRLDVEPSMVARTSLGRRVK